MATAPVSQFSIEDDDRPKKPQQQTAGGFTIGDIGPVTKGPDPAVMAASKARSGQKTQFEQQNEMGTAGRLATNAGLGIASGASGLPETMHPVRDAITGLIPKITQPFADAAKESLLSGATSGGVGTAMDIYNTGKELFSGKQPGESDQDVADRRAHAVGTVVGKVAPIAVGEGVGKTGIGPIADEQIASAVRTPNNTPRLVPRIVAKSVLPHWLAGEGLAQEALDRVLPMRTATDTAGRTYTPPNPTERAGLEADAADRTAIMDRTRKAEMAKARDIDATNKLNEQAQADAAAKKAEADKQLIREGRAVPITRNPNMTPEKIMDYEAGRRGTTPEAEAATKARNDELERLARASEQEEAEARKPVPLTQSPYYEQNRAAQAAEEEARKPVPLTQSPYYEQNRAAAAADEAARKPVPLTQSPLYTGEAIENYQAGRQGMTPEQAAAAKNPVIPSIITPQTQIEATQFSEGRPATWTNESLPSTIMNREAAMEAKRAAIQQLVLRNRPLPENARYLAGDANFGGVGSNPKSVTLFGPEGTPIDTTPSPLIQPIAPRPGAGIPRIADMADEYTRSLGRVDHPEVEHGTELSGPNASGESAVSREALARQASEKARGEQRIRIDTRSGKEIPLNSAEDVDARPGEHDVIVKRGPNGETVIDRGTKANYRPGQKATPEASRVSTSVEEPNTYEIGDEEESMSAKKPKPGGRKI